MVVPDADVSHDAELDLEPEGGSLPPTTENSLVKIFPLKRLPLAVSKGRYTRSGLVYQVMAARDLRWR